MDTLLIALALILGVVGLIGAVVPVIPGTIISYAGLLCASFTADSELGTTMLVGWGILSVAVIVMDYLLPGYLSKKFGGTKAGSIGATVGTILGIFLGPVGLILGPFAGAVVGEMLGKKLSFEEALKVGFGSMLSFLVGTVFKLVAGGFMIYYIIKDIF